MIRHTSLFVVLLLLSRENCLAQIEPQVPIVGTHKAIFYRMQFADGVASPDSVAIIKRFIASNERYVTQQSRGRLRLDWTISPVIKIDSNGRDLEGGYRAASELCKKAAEKSDRSIRPSRFGYHFFSIPSEIPLGAGGLGIGRGGRGTAWVTNIWIPGTIHEGFHALGVGHAEVLYDYHRDDFKVRPGSGGHDPYHFMGSEGSAAKKQLKDGTYEIDSPIPLPMKFDLGWVDSEEIMVVREAKEVIVYDHRHATKDSPEKPLGIAIDGHLGTLFISYDSHPILSLHRGLDKDDQIREMTSGLLVHLRPRNSPGICRLLDFRPNSSIVLQDSPRLRKALAEVDEFRDAAIPGGKSMVLGGGMKIECLETGFDDSLPWAKVRITF